MINALTLYELNNMVAEVISSVMPDEYWVEAEISEMRVVNGHCYMELVQKAEDTKTPVARASANAGAHTGLLSRLRSCVSRGGS